MLSWRLRREAPADVERALLRAALADLCIFPGVAACGDDDFAGELQRRDPLEIGYDRFLGATATPRGVRGGPATFSAQLHGMQQSVAQMQLKQAKVKRAHRMLVLESPASKRTRLGQLAAAEEEARGETSSPFQGCASADAAGDSPPPPRLLLNEKCQSQKAEKYVTLPQKRNFQAMTLFMEFLRF